MLSPSRLYKLGVMSHKINFFFFSFVTLISFFYNCISFLKMEIELIYNAMLISGVSMVIQLYTHISIPFQILFYYRLLQSIGYSSLCCTVGPCCLSISVDFELLIYPPPPSPLVTVSLLSTSVNL